ADVRHVADAGKLLYLAPVFAAVFGDLDQPVVGADVDQSFFLGRLGKRGRVAEERGGSVFSYCINAPNLAHHRQLVAIEIARELPADRGPTVTPIVSAEQFIGGEIESRV